VRILEAFEHFLLPCFGRSTWRSAATIQTVRLPRKQRVSTNTFNIDTYRGVAEIEKLLNNVHPHNRTPLASLQVHILFSTILNHLKGLWRFLSSIQRAKFGSEVFARYLGIVLMIIRNDRILQELATYVDPSQHLEPQVSKRKAGQSFHTQSTIKSTQHINMSQNRFRDLALIWLFASIRLLPLKKRVSFNNLNTTNDNSQNELHQTSPEKFDSTAIINPHPWGVIFGREVLQQHRIA
jgi:hypothetical protein